MKEITLTQGMVAIVDDEDFERLNLLKWTVQKGRHTLYAMTYLSSRYVYMHRFILEVIDTNVQVDHKDHDGLNNQKNNLRECTSEQNRYNMVHRKNGTSKYRGVNWSEKNKKWRSRVNKDKKAFELGLFQTEIEAAIAYNKKASELYGEFANLNIIS